MIRRFNPFPGLPLEAEDLLTEQEYHRGARRRHLRLFHGTGIVDGLLCELVDRGRSIAVSRGLALTPEGDEVELPEGVSISVVGLALDPFTTYRVVARHVEVDDPASARAPFGGGQPRASRIDEGATVLVLAATGCLGRDEVELCRFETDARGAVARGELDLQRADRWRTPARPLAERVRTAAAGLAEAVAALPGLLPHSGPAAAWLGMTAAGLRVGVEAKAVAPDDAAAMAWVVVSALDRWLHREAPAELRLLLADSVARAVLDWSQDADPGDERSAWARRWLDPLEAALRSAAAGASSAHSAPRTRFAGTHAPPARTDTP